MAHLRRRNVKNGISCQQSSLIDTFSQQKRNHLSNGQIRVEHHKDAATTYQAPDKEVILIINHLNHT